MGIVAKHVKSDVDGVCIAEPDKIACRRLLYNYCPLPDCCRVSQGIEFYSR